MNSDQKAKMVRAINGHEWFHARPCEAPACYRERGRFYAATYPKAVEYGKPFLDPDKVSLKNPLIGDDLETDIALFGRSLGASRSYRGLCREESRRKNRAQELGYDGILLLPKGMTQRFLETGRIPAGAELTLVDLTRSVGPASETVVIPKTGFPSFSNAVLC